MRRHFHGATGGATERDAICGTQALTASERVQPTGAGPLRWNERAQAEGTRRRVFCASMADVFDNKVPASWRADLWSLIHSTAALDWFLLTKRPQNIGDMLPTDWGEGWPHEIGTNHALRISVTGKGEDPTQWPADLRVQEFPQ